MNKVLIITGGSSGIGYATANHFASLGYKVYEFSRKGESREGVEHVYCDVTNFSDCQKAVDYVIKNSDRIDLVINNAGFGISGAIEFTDTNDAKKLFDVNFFGTHNVVRATVKYLKESHGRIINVGSVGGVLFLPFQAFYSATKSAINAYTLALRNEVLPYKVSVCAVLPGDVKTEFTAKREKSECGNDEYNGRIVRSVARMEKDEQSGMTTDYIAKKIVGIAKKKKVKPQYVLGVKYKFFVVLSKILPIKFVNWIVYLMYAK